MMRSGKFLSAEWRYLAMINYEIEPEVLHPFVPSGTELDCWNHKYFVSMVGFMFLNTRLLGLPVPFHRNFEEVNLRFYVRHRAEEGWRRGVVFIKELVPKVAIATVARIVYHENYQAMPMRHTLERKANSNAPYIMAEYGWWVNKRWNHLQVKTSGPVQAIVDGSEEEFIAEHYWGYAAQPDCSCVEYQVEHPRWQVWQVETCDLTCDTAVLYGAQFVPVLQGRPSSAFLAEGSPVIVRQGVKL